jgi:thymidylate synthase (FAD)
MSDMKAEYVDHMGTDLSVVNAARVSFDKVSEWEWVDCGKGPCAPGCTHYWKKLRSTDEKLISYLAKHNHWTPFAHTAITLRLTAPVPIRTQCFKHKAGFVENEESRRYISKAPEVFYPKEWRKAPTNGAKQGSSEAFGEADQSIIRIVYETTVNKAVEKYEWMIKVGVCPEQARFVLPQGVLVSWVWTGNLASYARFYGLRTDPHAQREVQDLAVLVGQIIEPLFPVSWKALTNG